MNRIEIENYIIDTYGSEPEHPWATTPENTVFRHAGNRKWFALIMTIARDKLGLSDNRMVDVMNVKCDPLLIGSFRTEPGIFPAYHMNKNNWLSIALDGSADNEKVKFLLEMSFEMTSPKIKKVKKQD